MPIPVELHAEELEGKRGQNWDSLGGASFLVCDNGEREGLDSSCGGVRVVHGYE